MLWSTAEQLRRVASYVCQLFHTRNEYWTSASSSSSPAVTTISAHNRTTQQQVDSYVLDYDDLEDRVRESAKSGWCCGRTAGQLWDNTLTTRAFPRFGGTKTAMSFCVFQEGLSLMNCSVCGCVCCSMVITGSELLLSGAPACVALCAGHR